MKIKQLNIEGFRGIVNKKITFPNDNVAILIGKNGSGKSSVLDLLTLHLVMLINNSLILGKIKNFENKSFNIDISISEHKSYNNNADEIKTRLLFQESKIEKSFGFDISRKDEISHKRVIPESLVVLEKIAQLTEKTNIPVITNHYISDSKFASVDMTSFREEPTNFQLFATDRAFETELDSFNDFKKWFEEGENFENEQKIAKKDFNWVNKDLDAIRNSIEYFLSYLPETRFKNLRINRISKEIDSSLFRNSRIKKQFIITKNGDDLLVDQLSDGEKKLLMLVTDLARRLTIANPSRENPLEGEGIVLIDEVELHLHPQWQRIVVPALSGTFPNIQFIISSHSPFVAQSVGLDNLLVLDSDPNQIEVKPSADDSEHSYQSIIKEVFGIDSFFSVEVENDLEQFRNFRTKILQGDKYDKSAFDKLVEKLTGYGYEIEAIIARELRQIERLTKEKTV
ncbi:MAG: putative ATP-binding protein involved in virulence [Arenicella sp.]|jgi:predicted ATP-binding protein involved in virulence